MIAKRIAACIAALMMIAGFTLMGATPAQADEWSCGSNRICLYEDNNFGGTRRDFVPVHRSCTPLYGFNDQATGYVKNVRSTTTVILFSYNNCNNDFYVLNQQRDNYMNGFNDRASSMWITCNPSYGC